MPTFHCVSAEATVFLSAVTLTVSYWLMSFVSRVNAPAGYERRHNCNGDDTLSMRLKSNVRSSSHVTALPSSGGIVSIDRCTPLATSTNTTWPTGLSVLTPRTASVRPSGDHAADHDPSATIPQLKNTSGWARVATTRSPFPSLSATTNDVLRISPLMNAI